MNRRSFLKRGLAGGALLALGGGAGLAAWPSRVVHVPTEPLVALTPKAFNTMAAVAARVVTVPAADPVVIAHTVDAALARAVPEARNDLVSVLHLLDSAVVGVMDGYLGPFSTLSPEAQDRALYAWRDSRLTLRRGAYKALKNLAATSYYRKEAAWEDAGYAGPPPGVEAVRQALIASESTTPATAGDGDTP